MTEYMNALIAQMRYIAFASIALALTFDYGIYREIGFKRLCYMIALIAAIASYNTIVDTGTAMFVSAKENARTEYYTTMRSVRQAIDNGKKEASWFERNILYYLVYLLLGFCDVLAWLSDQIQRCIVVLYKVCNWYIMALHVVNRHSDSRSADRRNYDCRFRESRFKCRFQCRWRRCCRRGCVGTGIACRSAYRSGCGRCIHGDLLYYDSIHDVFSCDWRRFGTGCRQCDEIGSLRRCGCRTCRA